MKVYSKYRNKLSVQASHLSCKAADGDFQRKIIECVCMPARGWPKNVDGAAAGNWRRCVAFDIIIVSSRLTAVER